MKKILIAVAVLLAVGLGYAFATTVTNELGQVVTVTTNATGVITTTITPLNAYPAMPGRTTVGAMGAQLTTNLTSTFTNQYTPRDYGDMLININPSATNTIWVAAGLTTNGWVSVSTNAP